MDGREFFFILIKLNKFTIITVKPFSEVLLNGGILQGNGSWDTVRVKGFCSSFVKLTLDMNFKNVF